MLFGSVRRDRAARCVRSLAQRA